MLARSIRQSAVVQRGLVRSTRTLSVLAPVTLTHPTTNKAYTATPTTIHHRQQRFFSSSPPPPPGGGGGAGGAGGMQLPPWMTGQQPKPGEYLDLYTTNLTQMAATGKLDPIIGRHEEIRRCLQILARRTKNSTLCIERGLFCLCVCLCVFVPR